MPFKDPVRRKEYHRVYNQQYYQADKINKCARTKELRNSKKLQAIEHLGGKCVQCGYDKCPAVLEFHHCDPNEKNYTINSKYYLDWEFLKTEIDKCQLLCANCHREMHWNENNGEMPEPGNGPDC